MVTGAIALVLFAQSAAANWNAPPIVLPRTQPASELLIWYRYSGDAEDDPIGWIVRIERTGLTNDVIKLRINLGDPITDKAMATPDLDYVAPPHIVFMHAEQQWIDIHIPSLDDDEIEANETVSIEVRIVAVYSATTQPMISPSEMPAGGK